MLHGTLKPEIDTVNKTSATILVL